MTSRGLKFSSNDIEERSRLLADDTNQDDLEVSFFSIEGHQVLCKVN